MRDQPPGRTDNEKTVPIDKIGTAPLREIPDEPAPKGVDPLTGRQTFRDELGWVGKFIGGRTEKAGNIAFMVVFVAAILLLVVMVGWITYDPARGEYPLSGMVTPLIGLLGTAMGYMFGKGSNGKDD
ncbi:hypothetical protein [Devosia ginsengisoli]|uniref:hypothetical protein n=1 Tax=Devosia ginsengisoli TaxID=400770 RepID=UPI0026F0AAA5|nr:hypothetical protein [Devosia ginsengisoli]MCR6670338.1 hypothetical protein [Devosia ginsengisoli]